MPDSDYTLPSITLQTDNVMLNEVVVTGSTFVQKKDHLLVLPDKKQIKHSFSGYDLLYNLMIPGLNIDRKSKTVTAMTGEATLYINGVEADVREVQNLQPKDIEKVEFYVLPASGKFMGDAASVNYITKVHNTGGYVTIDGEQNIGYLRGDYNVATKIAHGNTSYSLFGGYNMKEFGGMKNEKYETLFLSDNPIERTTANNGANYKNDQQYAQFKVSNHTKKHDLSATASFVRDATPDNSRNEILSYSGADQETRQSFSGTDNESMKSALKLNGVFNISKRQQLKIRLNGAYTRNTYDRIYTEGERQSSTNADEDFYSLDAQVAYRYQMDSRNSFYGRVTHFHNVTSSLYGGDYASWQHLWKGETLFQLDYTHMFGEKLMMMLSPGASWLNYKLHGNDVQRTLNMRLNASFRYVFKSKQWAGLGVSLGNSQPDISYLNTASQTVDFYQVKRGNPYLDNTRIFTGFAMYEGAFHRLLNVQCRLWYTQNWHNVYSDYYLEDDKLVSSYASEDSYNTVNAEVAVSTRFSENLRTNFNFKYGYMYVPGKSSLSQHNYSGSFQVNYFIKSFALNAYAKTQERRLEQTSLAFIKTPASYGFSVRYSGKGWMAEAGTESPFSKHLYYREYADRGVYKYNRIQSSRMFQQTAYIKLAYTLDFGKKTSRESDKVDRSINSAILKAN